VRKNEGGVLFTLNYGKAVSACVDPISKKPLSHFNPGSQVLSVAAAGCNFRCQFCDNWMISQGKEISGKSGTYVLTNEIGKHNVEINL
jgi:pyruvate formate lyase activating enzyme